MQVRGSANISGGNWLDFAESIAKALDSAENPRDADRRRRSGRAAGMWTKDVPGCRGIVQLLLAYAQAGNSLRLEANDVEIGTVSVANRPPVVGADGITVNVDYTLNGQDPSSRSFSIPYRNEIQRIICTGQWLQLNIGQVRFGSLIPKIESVGGWAKLTWEVQPQVELGGKGLFGLFRRVTHTELASITIGPDYGDFETSGVIGWGLPRMRWV